MASGGVSGNAQPFKIELGNGIIFVFAQCMVSAADVFKCSRPSAAGIAYATVFDIPGGNTGLLQRVAKMSGVSEIVLRAPVAAVNKENDWMRSWP
jgi:hypothetical protein